MNKIRVVGFDRGYWLTVDPGVHTAVALWHNGELRPLKTKTVAVSHKAEGDIAKAVLCIASRFVDCIDKKEILSGILIEAVEVYGSSAKSMASATRGNLSFLAYIVGALIAVIGSRAPIYLVSPRWKGQLPYKALRAILARGDFLGLEAPNDHVASAWGIGLWAKGRL